MKTSLLAIAIFAAAAVPQLTHAQNITVNVDSEPVQFEDQQPMFRGDRVMIPLRGTLEKLGVTVRWDPSNQTVYASKGTNHVVLKIGDIIAHLNDQPFELHVPALIMRGSTMVPLRFLSQSFGAKVTWHAESHTVDIRTGGDDN